MDSNKDNQLILNIKKNLNSLNNNKNIVLKKIQEITCSCKKKPLEMKLRNINLKIKFLKEKIFKLENRKNNKIIRNPITHKNNNNYKAVIIGINYYNSANNRLYGCVNDAKSIRNLLIYKFNFNHRNIKLLIDEPNNIQPNKKNIINFTRDLILSSGNNDKLFFFYSGHGIQRIDRSNDEKDNLDEALISSDLHIIRDDSIFKIFSKLNPYAKLFFLMDLCHSATVGDLQFTYLNLHKPVINSKRVTVNKNISMISSSKDNQLSYDAYIKNKYRGVLTYTFLKFIKSNAHLKNLTNQIRDYIKYKLNINQETVLSSSYFLRPGKNKFIF